MMTPDENLQEMELKELGIPKEKLIQIHYEPRDREKVDEFKKLHGHKSQMVAQRGFTSEGYQFSREIGTWIQEVQVRHALPEGMQWHVMTEDYPLFWRMAE